MDESRIRTLEQRLLSERERAVRAVRRLDETARASATDDGELSTWPLHLADEGTDAMEAEKALMLLGQEGRYLVDIDAALRRLYRDPDGFGVCEACGERIAFERLEIVPWALLCMACQTAAETGATPGVAAADARAAAADDGTAAPADER
jgi:DnaK suppressor protein